MEADHTMFFANHILMIVTGGMGFLFLIALGALFFVSRRSQKVMESLLGLLMRPERVRVHDAARVLQTVMAEELNTIEASFQNIRETLGAQIAAANKLKEELAEHNERLVATADAATKKLAVMSGRLDNTVGGLVGVVESQSWHDVEASTDRFSGSVNELLAKIDTTSHDVMDKVSGIQTQIDGWLESGQALSQRLNDEFETNGKQMTTMSDSVAAMQEKLSGLAGAVSDGFANVKSSAADYESVMTKNNKALAEHLSKMENFSKQAKKQLVAQVNTLSNTANAVGGHVRLAETSIDKQVRKLKDAAEMTMASSASTENSVRSVTEELSTLTRRFNEEVKEFASGTVSELKTVSGVATVTLDNTKAAMDKFAESVRAMATGVRETLIKMNTAHTQLTGQSANLIKMSAETTEQLQPLSVLIEKYFAALPDLSRGSAETTANLERIVSSLNEKITIMRDTVSESMAAISDSSVKIEDLAGQSRQQMIDLMSDYAKAVNTMQTLNKQMMVARASAPMDAIKTAPTQSFAAISSQDFLMQSERMFDKMHEQSLDLTRAAGIDIPDVVWKKYHEGDKTIFSKWLAKTLAAADKKRIRDLLKADAVFRSQASQFVRGFDKVVAPARQADNSDELIKTLLQTDLGRVYVALKPHLG
ncbi:hypothetical protein HDR66_01525 [bacterium]|nr:hypothetical protein [bacterium]